MGGEGGTPVRSQELERSKKRNSVLCQERIYDETSDEASQTRRRRNGKTENRGPKQRASPRGFLLRRSLHGLHRGLPPQARLLLQLRLSPLPLQIRVRVNSAEPAATAVSCWPHRRPRRARSAAPLHSEPVESRAHLCDSDPASRPNAARPSHRSRLRSPSSSSAAYWSRLRALHTAAPSRSNSARGLPAKAYVPSARPFHRGGPCPGQAAGQFCTAPAHPYISSPRTERSPGWSGR